MAIFEKTVLEEKLPIEERQGKKDCNQKGRTSVYLTIREDSLVECSFLETYPRRCSMGLKTEQGVETLNTRRNQLPRAEMTGEGHDECVITTEIE